MISGSGSTNTSVNVDRTAQLLVWKPGKRFVASLVDKLTTIQSDVVLTISGTSGTCSETQSPKFGFDEISGCFVSTETNCTKLRADVEAMQLQLLQGNKVARFGNPEDSNTDTDWIDVISRYLGFRALNCM